ncbi:double-stranded RNA-binding protein 3-like [Amaranthus tricolor]|uniref:double-stranded RNA-binding protein 3-like n=1 Tax=Amaranthus tricolor TaxID=29722 RepID=UPI00258D88DD|nr:double-stranded RNA-binding protein 3-like [Amaranthus tricolor]
MEAAQVNISNAFEDDAVFNGIGGQLIEASIFQPFGVSSSGICTDVVPASFENKLKSNPGNGHLQDSSKHFIGSSDPRVQVPASTPGVSNCYVFKSRLQEYAQKVGLPTPVYETIKEGPSHEPSFRSTVVVGGARYDSLLGFFNRKAAEQSAAEVALMELSKSGEKKDSISVPVHETGLCKNLLQEYAQKMNYAIPTYVCRKDDTSGRTALFSCTVEIGPIQYIGAAARTKKEAEIKAARTALLSIRSSGAAGDQNLEGKRQYTVVPCKRKMPETAPCQVKTVKVKKPKKPRFKKRTLRKEMQPGHHTQTGTMGSLLSNNTGNSISVHVSNDGKASSDLESGPSKCNLLDGVVSVVKEDLGPQVGLVACSQTQVTASSIQPDDCKNTPLEHVVLVADASSTHKENNNQCARSHTREDFTLFQ